jgi:hypothetical protein
MRPTEIYTYFKSESKDDEDYIFGSSVHCKSVDDEIATNNLALSSRSERRIFPV